MHAYDLKHYASEVRVRERRLDEQTHISKQQKPRFHVKLIAVCTLVGFVGMGYISKSVTVMQLNHKLYTVQTANQVLAQEVEELRAELRRLSSPYHLEELARTELGMVYPNQQHVIWKVVTTETEAAQPHDQQSIITRWLNALQELSRHVLG